MTAIAISNHAVKRWRERSDKVKNRAGCSDEQMRLELVELFERSRRAKLANCQYSHYLKTKYGPNSEYYVANRKSTKWLLVFGYGAYLVTVFKIHKNDQTWLDYITGEPINRKIT